MKPNPSTIATIWYFGKNASYTSYIIVFTAYEITISGFILLSKKIGGCIL